jgi:hypothetical protein
MVTLLLGKSYGDSYCACCAGVSEDPMAPTLLFAATLSFGRWRNSTSWFGLFRSDFVPFSDQGQRRHLILLGFLCFVALP